MKVLIVNSAYSPDLLGGAERSVQELSEALAASGHEVSVAALGNARVTSRVEDKVNSVRVYRLNTRAFPRRRSGLSKLFWHVSELLRVREAKWLKCVINRVGPDVIHFNNLAGYGWLAWFVARDVPSIQTIRDYYTICSSASCMHHGHDCNRAICKIVKSPFRIPRYRPTIVVGVSDYALDRVNMNGISAKGKLVTIYNHTKWIDEYSNFHNRARSGDPDGLTLGVLGSISPMKGTGIAIAAFERLLADHPSWVMHVGGTGQVDYVNDLKERYRSIIDSGNLQFLGTVNSLEFWEPIDIGLVPSQWDEPYGRVAAESICLGIPTIVSRKGGLPEVVELYAGDSRCVDPPGSISRWAAEIESAALNLAKFYSDRETFDERDSGLLAAPRQQQWNFQKLVTKYEATYREAIHFATS